MLHLTFRWLSGCSEEGFLYPHFSLPSGWEADYIPAPYSCLLLLGGKYFSPFWQGKLPKVIGLEIQSYDWFWPLLMCMKSVPMHCDPCHFLLKSKPFQTKWYHENTSFKMLKTILKKQNNNFLCASGKSIDRRVTKLDFLAGKPDVMSYCCHLFMRTIFQVWKEWTDIMWKWFCAVFWSQ